MSQQRWFDRSFDLGMSTAALPDLVERLRSTPSSLEDSLAGLTNAELTKRLGGDWSIAEHAGHLSDLEPLWLGRVDDLMARLPRLRPADLENRATWDADHNTRRAEDIVADFCARRGTLVERLSALTPAELDRTSLHPRLEQPMTVVDLCFFVAEHDDHHLATISALRKTIA